MKGDARNGRSGHGKAAHIVVRQAESRRAVRRRKERFAEIDVARKKFGQSGFVDFDANPDGRVLQSLEILQIRTHDAMSNRVFHADLAGKLHDFAADASAMGHDQSGLVEIIQRHADDGLSRPQNGHGGPSHRFRADVIRFVGIRFVGTERRTVFPIEKADDRMIDAGGSLPRPGGSLAGDEQRRLEHGMRKKMGRQPELRFPFRGIRTIRQVHVPAAGIRFESVDFCHVPRDRSHRPVHVPIRHPHRCQRGNQVSVSVRESDASRRNMELGHFAGKTDGPIENELLACRRSETSDGVDLRNEDKFDGHGVVASKTGS
ncbi:MAG: hypothetical protein ING19_08885 [Azospirillum sp.]|nr:hypothetical protein [Azospirillum sp.]